MKRGWSIGMCDECLIENKLCFYIAYTGVATLICVDCMARIVEQFAKETGLLIWLERSGT